VKLICSHCDRCDAAPLAEIPPGWQDIGYVHPSLNDPASECYIPELCGATFVGVCPTCDEIRRTASIPPAPEPERMLF
jgi:hypothetical protein